jgi:hypothetical protein
MGVAIQGPCPVTLSLDERKKPRREPVFALFVPFFPA